MNPNGHVRVVTAIVERHGKYLITRRRLTATLAGPWAFPGCRVKPGESDETTLEREVRDQLGVDVKVGAMKAHRTRYYTGYSVDFVSYETSLASEQHPCALHVADFRWVAPGELDQYPFPAADQPTADLLHGIKGYRAGGTAATTTTGREVEP